MSNALELPVCCAVLRRKEQILIVQRPPGKNEALKWEFPGGKLEEGETESACIQREISEELGLRISLRGRLRAVYKQSGGLSIKLMTFLGCPEPGELVLHEHQDYRWVRASQLASFDLCEADRAIAAILLEPGLEAQGWWL